MSVACVEAILLVGKINWGCRETRLSIERKQRRKAVVAEVTTYTYVTFFVLTSVESEVVEHSLHSLQFYLVMVSGDWGEFVDLDREEMVRECSSRLSLAKGFLVDSEECVRSLSLHLCSVRAAMESSRRGISPCCIVDDKITRAKVEMEALKAKSDVLEQGGLVGDKITEAKEKIETFKAKSDVLEQGAEQQASLAESFERADCPGDCLIELKAVESSVEERLEEAIQLKDIRLEHELLNL